MGILQWMEGSPVSEWIAQSDYGFPIMLSLHSVGLAAVVGITVMLDLRVLGFAAQAPLKAFEPLMAVAWIGFAINAASGTLMFMADAHRLLVNWPFWPKMACVLLGGLFSALLWRRLRSPAALVAPAGAAGSIESQILSVDTVARGFAVGSMASWAGAIGFGRLIAYVMDHAILHGGI